MILGLTLATILSSAEAGNAVSLERNAALDAALKEAVRRDRQERRATFWTQLPLGAVLLPTGIVLSSRSDPEARLLGVGFIVGGSLQLATAPLLLIPSSVESRRAIRMGSGLGRRRRPFRHHRAARPLAAHRGGNEDWSGGPQKGKRIIYWDRQK